MARRALRELVRQRARTRCEYCLLSERDSSVLPFQVEHVIARQHGGRTVLANLALACHLCNLHKGPNIAGLDPVTRRLVRLFDPRRMAWDRHFASGGPLIFGRTAIGRATVAVLNMNEGDRVALRQGLIEEGRSPFGR